ncbi:maleylpyruvate isomerase family mycothiol-dependent enzyme [Nocardia heshunensis]
MIEIQQWSRDRITAVVVEEFKTFAAMVRGLSETDLTARTNCDGWSVHHVIGHIIGSGADIVDNAIGSRTPDEQANAYLGLEADVAADMLDGIAERMGEHLSSLPDAVWQGGVEGVPGQTFSLGVLTLAHELTVHTDDIDTALGRNTIADQRWKLCAQWLVVELGRLEFEPLSLELTGLPRYIVNGGGGPVIATDPVTFVRAATGRSESAAVGVDFDLNIYGRDRRHIGV